MSPEDRLALLGLVGGLIGVAIVVYLIRFQKPKPRKYVQVPAKPGTVIELVADDGHVVGLLMLARITHDQYQGTSAEFVDFTRYMEDRRIETLPFPGTDRRNQP